MKSSPACWGKPLRRRPRTGRSRGSRSGTGRTGSCGPGDGPRGHPPAAKECRPQQRRGRPRGHASERARARVRAGAAPHAAAAPRPRGPRRRWRGPPCGGVAGSGFRGRRGMQNCTPMSSPNHLSTARFLSKILIAMSGSRSPRNRLPGVHHRARSTVISTPQIAGRRVPAEAVLVLLAVAGHLHHRHGHRRPRSPLLLRAWTRG